LAERRGRGGFNFCELSGTARNLHYYTPNGQPMTTIRTAKSFGRRTRGESGQALLEFALIAPSVILIMFGVLSFGLIFSWKNVLNNAAREGARAGAICMTDDQIRTVVAGNVSILPRAGSVAVSITSLDTGGNALPAGQRQRGGTVTVSLSYTANVVSIPGIMASTRVLTAMATFRSECSYP
jgi:Flp pilus assembly protein TadG